jgi:hypothetical protein
MHHPGSCNKTGLSFIDTPIYNKFMVPTLRLEGLKWHRKVLLHAHYTLALVCVRVGKTLGNNIRTGAIARERVTLGNIIEKY